MSNSRVGKFLPIKQRLLLSTLFLLAITPVIPAPAYPVTPKQTADEKTADEQPSDEQLRRLISQLGANSFQVREAATAQLLTLGPQCLPTLRHEAEVGDQEVRQRIEIIVERLMQDDFEARVRAFLDRDPESELPGWDFAQQRLGDTQLARETFVAISRKHPTYVQLLGGTTRERAESLNVLTQDLQASRRTLRFQPTVEDCLALLLVISDPEVPTTVAHDTEVISLVRRFEIVDALSDPEMSGPLRSLIGQWLVRVNSGRRIDAVHFAMQAEFSQAVTLAGKMLAEQADDVEAIAFAFKTIARFGEPADGMLVQPFLDDKRPSGGDLFYPDPTGRILQVEVRDLAMATVAVLNKRRLRDIGFPVGRENSNFGFDEETLGFPEGETGNTARQLVLEEVKKLLEQVKPTPAEKPAAAADQDAQPQQ
ncbi:hypothetical protein SH139x_004747 [Planctomycetaceae bacterium SH139]